MGDSGGDRSSEDPRTIHSIAITAADLVRAVETNRTTARTAVLRITPPFSGRMRARLHVEGGEPYSVDPEPIHVDPDRLLVEDPPAYPTAPETARELRADPDSEYTVDRHHEYHATRVDRWRDRLPEAVTERATIRTPAGPSEVTVAVLGDGPG